MMLMIMVGMIITYEYPLRRLQQSIEKKRISVRKQLIIMINDKQYNLLFRNSNNIGTTINLFDVTSYQLFAPLFGNKFLFSSHHIETP